MSRRKLPPQFSRAKGMLVFTPTGDDIKEAFERSEELGVLPNSFTRGMGRMTGFIGEIAFERLYPQADYVGDTSFTHDYVLGKKTIDVKSKSCTSIPQPDFTASVNDGCASLKVNFSSNSNAERNVLYTRCQPHVFLTANKPW